LRARFGHIVRPVAGEALALAEVAGAVCPCAVVVCTHIFRFFPDSCPKYTAAKAVPASFFDQRTVFIDERKVTIGGFPKFPKFPIGNFGNFGKQKGAGQTARPT
jgi:hypothetical protein